ncbi:hypothetical protein J1N35_041810 [Gossypium stocksii]|uniref:Uncharacterized protein n=1 Tax=Gossypium stocksii TaxID=47602 RepID=A0A9D3UG63_9ROSI|nr:hypothetical protein J1N35_041810 [Gossypium stocksii]
MYQLVLYSSVLFSILMLDSVRGSLGRYSKVSHMKDMDFKVEHECKGSSASLERKTIQELEINTSSLTLGSDNPELGTEALTQVVREVLEKVFEANLERNRESVQGRCEDCKKKRDRSSLRSEPHSAKRVRMHLSDSKGGASNEVNIASCGHYKKHHSGDCWKNSGACLKCGSKKHWFESALDDFKSDMIGNVSICCLEYSDCMLYLSALVVKCSECVCEVLSSSYMW